MTASIDVRGHVNIGVKGHVNIGVKGDVIIKVREQISIWVKVHNLEKTEFDHSLAHVNAPPVVHSTRRTMREKNKEKKTTLVNTTRQN